MQSYSEDVTFGKIIHASRSNYPEEIQVQLLETASGVGVRLRITGWTKVFLSHMSYVIGALVLFLLQFTDWPLLVERLDLRTLLFGEANLYVVGGVMLAIYAAFTGLEYLLLRIRSTLIRRRLSLHLVGADWEAKEPSKAFDALLSISPLIWIVWLIAALYQFPLAMDSATLGAFLRVYDASASDVTYAVQMTVALFVIPTGGILAGSRFYQFLSFKTEVDPTQIDIELPENRDVENAAAGLLAGMMFAMVAGLILNSIYLTELSSAALVLSFLLTTLAGGIGAAASTYGKAWPFVSSAIWLFFILLWEIFQNSSNSGFSWTIIASLFLIPVPLILGSYSDHQAL